MSSLNIVVARKGGEKAQFKIPMLGVDYLVKRK
jgi:hypothetical protein